MVDDAIRNAIVSEAKGPAVPAALQRFAQADDPKDLFGLLRDDAPARLAEAGMAQAASG